MARRVIPLGQPAPHEEPGGVVVDQRIGRAFVTVSDYASNSGLVRVFDTCTDALVRTIRVGAYAGAVAVDEQAGRVVVLHAPPPYYQGGRGRVTVLDAATEAVVRTVRVGTFPAALAVDARTHHVFVTAGHGAGSVRMLNALSGQLLRTVHVGLSPMAVAVDARTGRVFVAHHGEAGAVSLLDAATGAVLRTVHVGGTADAVIVDARAGRAFTTGDHDALRILSTASGAVVRTVTVPTAPGVVGATPAAVDTRAGFVFVLSKGPTSGGVFVLSKGPTSGGVIVGPGLVSVFDTRSGAPLGTAAAGRDNSAMALDDQRRRAFILDRSANTMIVLDYARLNVRAGAQRPSALCPPPQSITPTISLPHPGFALAVDTRTGRAFVKNGDGTLSVINTTDGRVLRTVQTDTRTRYPLGWLDPALAVDASRGHVFVANGGVVGSAAISGSVSMLDATSGVPLLTITAGRHPVAVALDRLRGRVFVANYGDGSVSVLDAATGAVLRTVQVGGAPNAIAVDERRGRVFVTNNGIGVLSVLDAATGAVVNSVPVSANTAAVDERAGRVFVASVAQLGTALGSDTLPSVEPPGAQHNAVFMLDARTGAILRTVHLRHKYAPGHLRALAVDERSGRVFVSKDGDVTMLDATRGTVLRAIDVGIAPAAMAVDEQTNHVWVTHWDSLGYYGAVQGVGSVSILNGTQGTVLKTLLVGVAPLVVAVDERQRRTFVLNGIYTRRSESSVTVLCET